MKIVGEGYSFLEIDGFQEIHGFQEIDIILRSIIANYSEKQVRQIARQVEKLSDEAHEIADNDKRILQEQAVVLREKCRDESNELRRYEYIIANAYLRTHIAGIKMVEIQAAIENFLGGDFPNVENDDKIPKSDECVENDHGIFVAKFENEATGEVVLHEVGELFREDAMLVAEIYAESLETGAWKVLELIGPLELVDEDRDWKISYRDGSEENFYGKLDEATARAMQNGHRRKGWKSVQPDE